MEVASIYICQLRAGESLINLEFNTYTYTCPVTQAQVFRAGLTIGLYWPIGP